MQIKNEIPLLEKILSPFKDAMGKNYQGYRNHCYRVIHFCEEFYPLEGTDFEKIVIAVAFHDLGLFTNKTIDYLSPSVALAEKYLKKMNKEGLIEEISLMIKLHHKITVYRGKHKLVEIFRKADLVDFSLGIVTSGISKETIREVKSKFPNCGFHKMLVLETIKWVPRHPLKPLPIFKW
jgi:hypothetical protein